MIAGVDTHSQTHHVAVLNAVTGALLGDRQVQATEAGYRQLTEFVASFGLITRVGVEGTASYGAGLSRHLRAAGIDVAEVIRPKRAVRRQGKSDPIDAVAAARQILTGETLPVPKDCDGLVEQIRVLLTVRRSAVKARTALLRQIKSLLVTAPDPIRVRWAHATSTDDLITALAATRPHPATHDVAAATNQGLRHLARRYQHLALEIADLETDLTQLVDAANPALRAAFAVGTVTAAQLLVTAGDNPDRLSSEAAFAALCGAAPIPASSGKTTRHRLNRGGDRQANAALHQIALTRLTSDPNTGLYVTRRRAEGKTNREIMRCLKRAIARQMWHVLVHPEPVPDTTAFRQQRQHRHLTLQNVADSLGTCPARISELERGLRPNAQLANAYQRLLNLA
ncbi:MAG: IS110 family transposase [Cellulomonas sp.]|nr:IS110 family transposase [Cellulomonas sp.]